MTTAYIDRVDTLNCVEEHGVIRSVTRIARVMGVENTNYTALYQALSDADVPVYGDVLDQFPFDNVILVSRSARVVNEDAGTVDVTLEYRHVLENASQQIDTPINDLGILYGKMKSSLTQKTTNLYSPQVQEGQDDPLEFEQHEITVDHTFGADDPIYKDSNTPNPNNETAPWAIVQGGEISVFVPHRNYVLEGTFATFTPWSIEDQFLNTVNQLTWLGQGPYTWLCTEVQWSFLKSGIYKFAFEFQHNPSTWYPWAVFIDQRTGRPPPGLVNGHGKKQIPYYFPVDYNVAFGAIVEF